MANADRRMHRANVLLALAWALFLVGSGSLWLIIRHVRVLDATGSSSDPAGAWPAIGAVVVFVPLSLLVAAMLWHRYASGAWLHTARLLTTGRTMTASFGDAARWIAVYRWLWAIVGVGFVLAVLGRVTGVFGRGTGAYDFPAVVVDIGLGGLLLAATRDIFFGLVLLRRRYRGQPDMPAPASRDGRSGG